MKTITYKHNANNQRVAKLVDGVVVEKYLSSFHNSSCGMPIGITTTK